MQIGIKGGFFLRSFHTDVIDNFRNAHSEAKDDVIAKTMGTWAIICDYFNDGNQRTALGLLFDIVQLEKENLEPNISINQKIANTAKARESFTAMKGLIKNGYTLEMTSSDAHQLCFFANCPKVRHIAAQEIELPIHFNQSSGQIRSTFLYTSQGTANTTDDACKVFSGLCNATSMKEKLQWFEVLQQLDGESNQDKYVCKYDSATKKLLLLFGGLEIECMEPICDQATIAELCPESLRFVDVEYDIGLLPDADGEPEIECELEFNDPTEFVDETEVDTEIDIDETSPAEEDTAFMAPREWLELDRQQQEARQLQAVLSES